MVRVVVLIFPFLLNLIAEMSFAQCCASGNPFISDAEQPALQKKVLITSLTYRYSHSSKFYHNDSPYNELKFSQTANVNYAEFQVGYGITDWFTVIGDLGYFFNKTMTVSGQEPMRGYGPGDAGLYLKFNIHNNVKTRLNISPGIGTKFPIGIFDQEVDNVKLPISLQPSSGSYKYLADIFISKGVSRKINIAGFFSYEYSQLIESENFYYKYGDQWITALYINYRPWKRISVDFQARNEYRGNSRRENKEIVESSGYDVLFFTPQLSFAFKHNWFVSAYADLPIYKYYNGIQMSFGYAMSVRVTRKLDFIALKTRHSANRSNKVEKGNNH